MQISKIAAVSAQHFGMAKSQQWESPKFLHHLEAEKSVPGSELWFYHKGKMIDLIKEQLQYDSDLTPNERLDLERDKFLLETDVQNKKNKIIYG